MKRMDAGTVIVHFASGHPARIDGHNRLALLVALLGQPARIIREPEGYRATWMDDYGETFEASIPRLDDDGREIVRLQVTPDVYQAAAEFGQAAACAQATAEWVLKHLASWADTALFDDEREAVIDRIVAFVSEYPDVIERGYSWPEIRRLADEWGA